MSLTLKQKKIKERRATVRTAYDNLSNEDSKSVLVKNLASKFEVTEVTIWNDLKLTQ